MYLYRTVSYAAFRAETTNIRRPGVGDLGMIYMIGLEHAEPVGSVDKTLGAVQGSIFLRSGSTALQNPCRDFEDICQRGSTMGQY